MSGPTEPRRRFVPVPIETTFEQYRKSRTGPVAEPTPSPSTRSASPPPPSPPREKRKFAPQLVESSVRRSRRAGDEGPATRPTDRTDITPYTKHIYAPRFKRRHGAREQHGAFARRESCDDEVAEGVFDLVARDAQRRLQEAALSAFPNSNNMRIGGAEHFYVRESSDDDSTRGRTATRGARGIRQSRRNSSTEDISWAFKEMQEHAASLEAARERISTPDLDRMSIDYPPSDAMGLTRGRLSVSSSGLWSRPSSIGTTGDYHMPYVRPESPLPTIGESGARYRATESPRFRPIGESHMPFIPSAPAGRAADMPYVPASHIPAETGFGSHRPANSPFSGVRAERDMSLERLRNYHRLRTTASPAMLGDDLVFRKCPSPEQTKLEPDHLWDLEKGATVEETNRDITGQYGLWRGYCFTSDMSEQLALAERPAMVSTPYSATPDKGSARALSASAAPAIISEEPESTWNIASVVRSHSHTHHYSNKETPHADHRARHRDDAGGIFMLQGLDERLRKEKAAAELEEKIIGEFDDVFVTQVYNYLSLGYPATARAYDEELSKISRISVQELEKNDDDVMEALWATDHRDGDGPGGRKASFTGHIMIDSEEKPEIHEDHRTPRWKALKKYIYEWARQHPDLDAISPLAWGVQERRGSWGI